MNLDFSLSAEDWLGYFRTFIDILVEFFSYLGIKLFTDSEVETAESGESETE